MKGQYPDTEHVIFRILPEVTVASATRHGSCEHMNELYAAVTQWIVDDGYELDGPMFNISRMNIIKVITCILNFEISDTKRLRNLSVSDTILKKRYLWQ